MPVICKSICYSYRNNQPVLDDFSAEIGIGTTLLVGYSGCGKSTLLKIIAGFLTPEKGTVLLDGDAPNTKKIRKDSIGFVFQQLNLLPLSTVRQNLLLSATLSNLNSQDIEHSISDLSNSLGLQDLLNYRPIELSGGQQQRAAIARALIKKPKYLLLDEPTSGLDDLNTQVISRQLTQYATDGGTCIIATHDTRLEKLQHARIDFNRFLPVERHLQAVAQ